MTEPMGSRALDCNGGDEKVETYDIIMLVVLVGATLFGAIKGLAWQVASVASLVASYVVAYKYREPFSEAIKADPPWNRFLAMLILYVGTSLVIWVLFRMVSHSIDKMKLKEFDRQIGALIGLAKGVLFCTLITMFAVALSGPTIREQIVRSRSGYYIAKVLDKSYMVIPPELHEVIWPYIDRFERQLANPSSDEGPQSIALPWKPSESAGAAPGASPNDAPLAAPINIPWPPQSTPWFPQNAGSGQPPVR